MRSCEICGADVLKSRKATTCGHRTWLCDECMKACPGADRLCVTCEDRGVNPEPKGHEDRCTGCSRELCDICGQCHDCQDQDEWEELHNEADQL